MRINLFGKQSSTYKQNNKTNCQFKVNTSTCNFAMNFIETQLYKHIGMYKKSCFSLPCLNNINLLNRMNDTCRILKNGKNLFI